MNIFTFILLWPSINMDLVIAPPPKKKKTHKKNDDDPVLLYDDNKVSLENS